LVEGLSQDLLVAVAVAVEAATRLVVSKGFEGSVETYWAAVIVAGTYWHRQ
jgi:hypothetical protein